VAKRQDRELREEKSWGQRTPVDDGGFAALAQLESRGLHPGRPSSLVAKMPTPKTRVKRSASRGLTRVKGFASCGRTRTWKKWILILLVALLLVPAMQVAVVRFINPPLTLPMLIDQGSAMFLERAKAPTPLPLDRSAADS